MVMLYWYSKLEDNEQLLSKDHFEKNRIDGLVYTSKI
jgi:hypothetical protein